MVFSVSDEARVGGQEMAVEELPCLEHALCRGLGWRGGGGGKLRPEPPQPVAPLPVLLSSARTCSRLTLKSRDSSLLVRGV